MLYTRLIVAYAVDARMQWVIKYMNIYIKNKILKETMQN